MEAVIRVSNTFIVKIRIKFVSIVCSPAPDLENGFKNITNQIIFNDTMTLELEVVYSCDLGLILVPEDKNNWTCQSPGLWSHTTLPKCLKGISNFFT